MDPLNWILVTWLAVAGFIFFIVQKVIEFWPVDPSTSSIGDSNQQNLQQHQQSYSNSSTLDVKHLKSSTGATSFFGFSPSHQQQQQQQQQQYHSYQTKSVESVDWMNDFLAWLFQHYKGSPDFLNSWLKSMNDAAKKIAPLVGCEVLFEEISTEDRRAPQLSNIRTEQGPREHLTLRGRLYSPSFNLRLVTSQKLPDRLIVTNYDAKLTNLTGDAQIRAACIGNELFLMACFDGRPDVTIHLENKDLHGVEQVDHSCVQEAIRKSLMSSVTNLSIRGNHGQSTESVEDVFRRLNASAGVVVTGQPDRIKSNRLLVKILKAEKLEGTEIPQQPYVVIEIDEPPQKHTTTLGLNACPVWDEHFLFDVNRRSEELLFEVYDKRKPDDDNPHFVGLAIVGLEELRQSAITSHALKLQPRPYTNERVQGVLFVECMFLYEMGAGKETEIIRDELDHGIITQTTTTTKRPLVAISSDVKDGDRTVINVTPTKTSSVIVKSVSQYIHGPAESTDHIAAQESTTKTTASTNATRKSSKEIVKPALKQTSAPSTPKSTASRVSATPGNERGRKPERPSFFSDLKQKLSFKGKKPSRAQSLDQGQGLSPTDVTYHPPRSISQPPSRDQSATRHPELGAAGSDSELSVTSNDSIYHQSSLVVETIENSVKKYHLIPTSLIRHPNAKKLMKLGRKLHIYNEHTFVAVKVPSSTTCKVCLKAVTGAFRRQGYQCRDCRMVCHKKCHFKTEIRCPNSKVSTLQMYVTSL